MAGKKRITPEHEFIARRRVARRLAMQGVYQWLINGNAFQEIYLHLQEDKDMAEEFRKADVAFLHRLLRCAIDNAEAVEQHIAPYLDRKLSQVDVIESAVMRVATCELLNHPESPTSVVLDEYINLSKKFGAEQSHKYVNGILGKVAASLRPATQHKAD